MGTTDPAIPNDKKRKRPRAARACEFCRAKKYRCDELYPCSQCKRQKVECVYEGVEHIRQRMLMSNPDETESVSAFHQDQYMTATSRGSGEYHTQARTKSRSRPPVRLPSPQHPTDRHGDSINPQQHRATVESAPEQGSEAEVEVADVNQHTQNVEFHGKTSSIAFLAALNPQNRTTSGGKLSPLASPNNDAYLVSAFHNNAFSPDTDAVQTPSQTALDTERYYFRQSRLFLEGHFQNIHFVHPIVDKSLFMSRCEDLWFSNPHRQSMSFIALYYSVMSLGALVRTWDDGEKLDGLGRLQWSRKLFQTASTALKLVQSNNDIETIQAYFFMAKVSQNELNPSHAYTLLGLATRTCFSAGYNREPKQAEKNAISNLSDTIAKTWWGLYSLEIEVSFALGRPDSLGADEYHNRKLPWLDNTETAIIPAMVDFAKIVRKVCTSIYLSDHSMDIKIEKASQIERDMEHWLSVLPDTIRPVLRQNSKVSRIVKEPLWAKRQRLVLELRYHNVKMVLFRPFLALVADRDQVILPSLRPIIEKCLEAGRQTIIQMHEIFINQAFFRTWWYNTTYVLYAASIVLCYATKVAPRVEVAQLLDLGDNAVDILEAMDESVVARNASVMVKQIISQARERLDSARNDTQPPTRRASMSRQNEVLDGIEMLPEVEQVDFADMNLNLDFFDLSFTGDGALPFWTDPGGIADPF